MFPSPGHTSSLSMQVSAVVDGVVILLLIVREIRGAGEESFHLVQNEAGLVELTGGQGAGEVGRLETFREW